MTTITNTAQRPRAHVEEVPSNAQAAFLELSSRVRRIIDGTRKAQGRGIAALLSRLGLQRRQSAFGPVFWLAAGAVATGIAVFLMSPISGKEVRRRIATFLGGETETNVVHVTAVEQRGEPAAKCEALLLKTQTPERRALS